jgi:hypothetical protein
LPSTASRHLGCGSARKQTGSSYAVAGLLDAARVSFSLWRTLKRLRRPDLVLVQNPPAFPTLVVTWFSLRHRGVRFVIDWHNLGYTLLQLHLGSGIRRCGWRAGSNAAMRAAWTRTWRCRAAWPRISRAASR